MDQQPDKLVITFAETQSHRAEQIVQQFKEAETYVTVRDVGVASDANSGATLKSVLTMAGAGLLGGFVAFGLQRIILSGMFPNSAVWVQNLGFTFIIAFGVGLTIALVEAGTQKNAKKVGQAAAIAVPTAVGVGLGVGAAAHFLYSSWTDSIVQNLITRIQNGEISEEQALNMVTSQLHLPRGVAWAIVGIGIGITIGAASRSWKRMALTAGGGFVGGFLGGFLFDYVASALATNSSNPDTSEIGAQIAGMLITGLLVGLSMSLVEQASKARWIEIVSGGMAGKQFILYKPDITIGASPSADITLIKDPAIPAIAARLVFAGGHSMLYSLDPNAPANVGNRAGQSFELSDAMQITIGSTIIRYRERSGKGATFDRIEQH